VSQAWFLRQEVLEVLFVFCDAGEVFHSAGHRVWTERLVALFHDHAVVDRTKVDVWLFQELLKAVIMVLIGMCNDGSLEVPSILEFVVSPAEATVHVVVFADVDHKVLILRRDDERAVSLADIDKNDLTSGKVRRIDRAQPGVSAWPH
jgi:hypothetical protein